MKKQVIMIAALLLSLAIHAQKSYCAPGFTIRHLKDGNIVKTTESSMPIAVLLFEQYFYVLHPEKASIEGALHDRDLRNPKRSVYRCLGLDEEENITVSAEIRVEKGEGRVRVFIDLNNIVLEFETTDGDIT